MYRPSSWSKQLDLDVSPTPTSLCRFCGVTDKSKSAWFWDSNKKTVAVILRHKSSNRSCWFWGPNQKTLYHLGFEAQSRNSRSSSPCARCRPHTTAPNLSIVRPPSTWLMWPFLILCTRSPTLTMILVAAHHATPATCTPRDKQIRFSKQTNDKDKTIEPFWIQIQISLSQ
jgi:hypothetical protein